ncbi:unnamed protein product [Gordionus sp. m RMFG-2023]
MHPENVHIKSELGPKPKPELNIVDDRFSDPIDLAHHYFVYRNQILIITNCRITPIFAIFGILVNVIVIVYLIKLIQRHPLEDQVQNIENVRVIILKWLKFQLEKVVGSRIGKIFKLKYLRILRLFKKIKKTTPRNDIESMVGFQIASISTRNMNTTNIHNSNERLNKVKKGVYKRNDLQFTNESPKKLLSKMNKRDRAESSSYIILLVFCAGNLLLATLALMRVSVECLANEPFKHIRELLIMQEKSYYNASLLIRNNKMKFRYIYDNLRLLTTPSPFGSSRVISRATIGTITRSKPTIKNEYIYDTKDNNILNKTKEMENKGSNLMHESYNKMAHNVSVNWKDINSEIEAITEFIIINLRYSKAFRLYMSYGWNFFMAKLHIPLALLLVNFNFFITILYTMNRFIYTVYEFEYYFWCKLKNTILEIVACGLLSFLLYLPTTFNYIVVAINVSSYFLFQDYIFVQNGNYHFDDKRFPLIKYYSFKKRNTGFGSSRKSKRIWLIYEINREIVCKFIVIGVMGYLIILIAKEMVSKRWLFDKRHWSSIAKISIKLTPNNKEKGVTPDGNVMNSGNQKENVNRVADRRMRRVMARQDTVELLNLDNMPSRHRFNWNRKFFLTLLRVFWVQALIFIVPVTLLQITGAFWTSRIRKEYIEFIFAGVQIANLLAITLPFPITFAIMMCS